MIQINIDRTTLIKFLSPLSKLGDKAVLRIGDQKIYTVMSSEDSNIILYASSKLIEQSNSARINVIDIKKFIAALDCFEEEMFFYLKDNYILCESQSLSGTYFKYHLVDDSIIKDTSISIEKISKLNFDTEFALNRKNLADIAKGSFFTADTNKIYLYTKDDCVFAELTDKEIQNTNSITFKVSDSFTGMPVKDLLTLNYEIFRNLTTLRCENVKVKINNENKVVMFNIIENNIELKYIISTLIK